jgi:hypothetical protein
MKQPATITGKSSINSLFLGFLLGGIALVFTLLHSLYSDESTPEVNVQPGQLEARYRAEVGNILNAAGVNGGVDNCGHSFKRFSLSCGVSGTDLQAIRLAMTNRGWLFFSNQMNEASRAGVSIGPGLPDGIDIATFKCTEEKRILNCALRLTYKMNL